MFSKLRAARAEKSSGLVATKDQPQLEFVDECMSNLRSHWPSLLSEDFVGIPLALDMLQGENTAKKQQDFENLCDRIEKAMDLIVDTYYDGLKGSLELFSGLKICMRRSHEMMFERASQIKAAKDELVSGSGKFQLFKLWVKERQLELLLRTLDDLYVRFYVISSLPPFILKLCLRMLVSHGLTKINKESMTLTKACVASQRLSEYLEILQGEIFKVSSLKWHEALMSQLIGKKQIVFDFLCAELCKAVWQADKFLLAMAQRRRRNNRTFEEEIVPRDVALLQSLVKALATLNCLASATAFLEQFLIQQVNAMLAKILREPLVTYLPPVHEEHFSPSFLLLPCERFQEIARQLFDGYFVAESQVTGVLKAIMGQSHNERMVFCELENCFQQILKSLFSSICNVHSKEGQEGLTSDVLKMTLQEIRSFFSRGVLLELESRRQEVISPSFLSFHEFQIITPNVSRIIERLELMHALGGPFPLMSGQIALFLEGFMMSTFREALEVQVYQILEENLVKCPDVSHPKSHDVLLQLLEYLQHSLALFPMLDRWILALLRHSFVRFLEKLQLLFKSVVLEQKARGEEDKWQGPKFSSLKPTGKREDPLTRTTTTTTSTTTGRESPIYVQGGVKILASIMAFDSDLQEHLLTLDVEDEETSPYDLAQEQSLILNLLMSVSLTNECILMTSLPFLEEESAAIGASSNGRRGGQGCVNVCQISSVLERLQGLMEKPVRSFGTTTTSPEETLSSIMKDISQQIEMLLGTMRRTLRLDLKLYMIFSKRKTMMMPRSLSHFLAGRLSEATYKYVTYGHIYDKE